MMAHLQIAQALNALAPGALWSLSGDDLSGLVWLDQTIPRPTDSAINAQIATPVIPQEVRMDQGRLALLQAGLLDQVNAAVQAATKDVQIMWEYSPTLNRQNAQLKVLAQQLNLTDTALDHLFVIAATL